MSDNVMQIGQSSTSTKHQVQSTDVQPLKETLLNIAIAVAILGGSYVADASVRARDVRALWVVPYAECESTLEMPRVRITFRLMSERLRMF